jgi:hypothetical protein
MDHGVGIGGQLRIETQVRLHAYQLAGLQPPLQIDMDQFHQGGPPLGLLRRQIVGHGGPLAALPGVLEALLDLHQVGRIAAAPILAGFVACGHDKSHLFGRLRRGRVRKAPPIIPLRQRDASS